MGNINWQYIIDGAAALYGLYVLLSAIKMKITGEISSFVASPEELFKCHDKAAFAREISNKMILFGFLTCLFGVSNIINEWLWQNKLFGVVTLVLFLAVCGWFLLFQRRQREKHLNLS